MATQQEQSHNIIKSRLEQENMECGQCKGEISYDSKFCGKCGAKVEEKPWHVRLDDSIKSCARGWFILGFIRGKWIGRKEGNHLEEFESKIREKVPEFWEEYQEMIKYWEDMASKNDDNKTEAPEEKGIRPKQGGVRKTKRLPQNKN